MITYKIHRIITTIHLASKGISEGGLPIKGEEEPRKETQTWNFFSLFWCE